MLIENQTKNLKKQMAPYEKATTAKSIWQLIHTIVPFLILWFLAYESLSVSYVLTFALSVVAAAFLIRIFIIFHDCTHYAFFRNRKANKIVGTLTGVLTLFPYEQWGHDHSVHHATSGNLDKRGIGDIWVMTVEEYNLASWLLKIGYHLYRNPLIMFGLGPIYQFLIKNRFNRKGARVKERMNTYLTNLLIAGIVGVLCLTIGWENFLFVQVPIFLISGSAGIWLFYVQHTFEDSYYKTDENWEYVKAAVQGSSFYKLPKMLQWLTGNIGFHHVHHLSPRVPNYLLEEAHKNTLPLQNVPTITLKTSLQSLRFRLWDEEKDCFVSFKENRDYSKNRLTIKVKPEL